VRLPVQSTVVKTIASLLDDSVTNDFPTDAVPVERTHLLKQQYAFTIGDEPSAGAD
jgi:hypothetical protein